MRRNPARTWAAAALILALAASLYWAFAPCTYEGTSQFDRGPVTQTCGSLVDENGSGVIVLLALPVGLALVGLWGAVRGVHVALGLSAFFLCACVAVGALTIGFAYFPAAFVLGVAAFIRPRAGPEPAAPPPGPEARPA